MNTDSPDLKAAMLDRIRADAPRKVWTPSDFVDLASRDMTTSGKKWSEDKAHTSPQPTLYRESVKEATGEYPEKLLFDVLVSTKSPALQTITTSRTEDDLAILVRQFGIMTASIQAGIFQPAERDSWMCSMKWCGYYFTCPHIPAHRKVLPKRSA